MPNMRGAKTGKKKVVVEYRANALQWARLGVRAVKFAMTQLVRDCCCHRRGA